MAKIKTLFWSRIELLKKEWLAIGHFLVAILVSYFIYLLACWEPISDIIRNMILAKGGIGGFYALIIAKRRQDRFEDQVQLQQDQRFSEKLSSCLNNMSNKSSIHETAGILLLEELYETSPVNQRETVGFIIEQFIKSKSGEELSSNDGSSLSRIFSFFLKK